MTIPNSVGVIVISFTGVFINKKICSPPTSLSDKSSHKLVKPFSLRVQK